jgi:hypothetical protein
MTNHPTPNELITAQTYFLGLLSNSVVGSKLYEAALWRAYLAAREDVANQDTIKDLIAAFEPILELAKRKADYPADLGMVTRADEALTRAKGQS